MVQPPPGPSGSSKLGRKKTPKTTTNDEGNDE